MDRSPWSTDSTTDALDMLEDVSARARAMKLGLVSYPVHEVEQVCAALRAVRQNGTTRLAALTERAKP
jgi:hypothetical protein